MSTGCSQTKASLKDCQWEWAALHGRAAMVSHLKDAWYAAVDGVQQGAEHTVTMGHGHEETSPEENN